MFYAPNVLGKKSVLGPVWLAAHHDVQKKLTKLQINSYNVSEFTDQIQKQDGEETMALRLSSFLLIGVSRIFSQKVHILLQDCNDAYSKITLAFKPSNVDMAPMSRNAQYKAITDNNLMQEDAGISGLDLDLELNLTEADWVAGGERLSQSQALWADITLPDVVTQGTDDGKQWEEEDPLFFGGAMQGADNPLDVNYDLDIEQMREEVEEEPELRRDSDGSAINIAGGSARQSELRDASQLELPDIEFEPDEGAAAPRESGALGGELPSPLRMSDAALEFGTPNVEVKVTKRAKKGKLNLKKDKNTNLDTEMYKKWISDPDSVKELLRAPRPLPRDAHAARGQRHQALAAQGKLVETLVKEPLQGHVGKRLTALYVARAEHSSGGGGGSAEEREEDQAQEAPASSKKRKSRSAAEEDEEGGEREKKEEEEEHVRAAAAEPELDDMYMPEIEADFNAVTEATGGGNAFGGLEAVAVEESLGDEGEVDADADKRLTERTKKAIVMLQKQYTQHTQKKQALSYNKIMQPPDGRRPNRTEAAVAFFELLHLHAKGYVELAQPKSYADISIAATEKLHRFTY